MSTSVLSRRSLDGPCLSTRSAEGIQAREERSGLRKRVTSVRQSTDTVQVRTIPTFTHSYVMKENLKSQLFSAPRPDHNAVCSGFCPLHCIMSCPTLDSLT